MNSSKDFREIGVLMFVLQTYGRSPKGLFARMIDSSYVPSGSIVGLALCQALGPIPAQWAKAKQIEFWNRWFVMTPDFLPGPRARFAAIAPKPPVSEDGGISSSDAKACLAPSPFEWMHPHQISDPEIVDAIFQRIRTDASQGAQILSQLWGFIALDEHVRDQVEALWPYATSDELRQCCLAWLSFGSSSGASGKLFRIYYAESDPQWRAQVGDALISNAGSNLATTCQTLLTWERDDRVRIAMVKSLGETGSDVVLDELEAVAQTGTDPIRSAVRSALQVHLDQCERNGLRCDHARELLQRLDR